MNTSNPPADSSALGAVGRRLARQLGERLLAGWARFAASPLAIAIAYACLGVAWIVMSDRLLLLVAPDAAALSALGQGKGVAFVLATSGLVYLIALRRSASKAGTPQEQSERPSALLWVFALLSATVVLAGLVCFARSAHRSQEQRIGELRREAELRAEIVQSWIERRNEEGHKLATAPLLRDTLMRWHRNPDAVTTTQLRQQMTLILASTRYTDAMLLDGQGAVLLAPDGLERGVSAPIAAGAKAAFQHGSVDNSDFYVRPDGALDLRFDLFVPVAGADGRVEAVLVLRAAPQRVLLPRLLGRGAAGEPEAYLFQTGATNVLTVGIDGTSTPQAHASPNSRNSVAEVASRPSLLGTLVDGLSDEGKPMAAVAASIHGSAWHVAVQTSRQALENGAMAAAAILAVVNVLAVLTASAVVYAVLQRRELKASSRAETDRREKERAWKIVEAIANCSTDLIFAKDIDGRYIFVNRELCKALDRRPDELIGFDSHGIFPAGQVQRLLDDDAIARLSEKPLCVETKLTTADGDRVYACTKGRLVDSDGNMLGIFGVSCDITERRNMLQRMRQWATVFEDIRDGVVITDSLGCIQSVNRAFSTITGHAARDAVGSTLKLIKSGRHGPDFYSRMWSKILATGHWQGEIWNRRKNGEVYPEWLTISAVRDENRFVTHYVGVFTDISRLKHSEAQTDWLFKHDPLTGLPNRLQLQQRLEDVLARSRRREARAVLLVIDLDGFKTVNDSLGHPAGDELLVCVAQRLQGRLRQDDVLGRLGGDEFLVILENSPDRDGVAPLARDLLAAVSAPVALSCGQDAYLTASIGISMYPDEGDPTAVELLRDADAAMYRAKELGRNQFCFYTGDLNTQAMAKLELEAALSRAIERNELLLHFQPKIDAHSGKVAGAEALLRWRRSEAGLVPPGEFIPLAENSSLILAIGAWVIDAACRQIRSWMDADQPVVPIAVNVAARQFAAGDLDAVVSSALALHRVPPHFLELELTEGMLIGNPQAGTQMLQRLRDIGIQVSLDDFGTGYSSLAYLQQLPIDALKIDQSFVMRIGVEPDGEALVDAVIGLAHRLRLKVVAEGVETAAQRDHLRRQGCDEMQGYYFGRPAPACDLQALLEQQASVAA